MNTIPEQPLSTGGIEPTPQNDSKSKQSPLKSLSYKVQSKQLPERGTKAQKAEADAENAATKKTADNDNTSEIINFLIEHDNASNDNEIPSNILLNSLLEECRGSEDREIQKAVENFDETVGNTAEKAKGKIKIQEAFVVPSQCPPSTGTRNLPHVKVRESVDKKVNDEIRQPLFNAVKSLVLLRLEQTKAKIIEDAKDTTNGSTFSQMAIGRAALRTEQVKYIALLSSIDREETISLLQSDDGCMLLPTYLRNPNASPEVNYRNFLEDLCTLTHPAINEKEAKQNPDNELFKKYGGNETEPLLKAIYSNIVLGRPLYRDGARKVLSAENSPYFVQRRMELLKMLAEEVEKAYWLYDRGVSSSSNLKPFGKKDLEGRGLGKFKLVRRFGEHSYVSQGEKSDELLHISLREVKEISLAEAKMLGLVTPENAKELEKQGIQTVTPMFIVPRWEADSEDTKFTAIPNIMGMTPEALKHAEKFTKKVLEKIEEENETRRPPYVPVCAGFCMGAMTAQAIGAKYNIPSLVFNPFNPDPDVLERFAGTDKIEQANDPEHALCHQIYRMIADYISDPNFSDSQVRDDISKELLAPEIEALEGALKELHQHLETPVTFKNFTEWLSTANSNLKNVFDKNKKLLNKKSIALKYEVKNFFANKPAMVGQSYLLDIADDQKEDGDGDRHIGFPEAIAKQPNYGGKGVIEEDLAERMINVIKKADSIRQQVISSIGENEVNRLGEDKAIEQWVENSLMDYDHENWTNTDVDRDVKLDIMKVIKISKIIENDQDLRKQITILIGENTIEQWIKDNFVHDDSAVEQKITDMLNQNLASIVNGITEAINKDPDVSDWITRNIENGDIRHWVNDTLENNYRNKDWATISSKEDIKEWITRTIVRNKVTQVIENDKDLKKQITTLIGEKTITDLGEDEAIEQWIEDNFVHNNLADRLEVDIHDDDAVKQKITDTLNQNLASIVNGITEAINKNQKVKNWVTRNVENGNIEQWIQDNIPNTYENKNQAEGDSKDVRKWITRTMIQNKMTQVIENDKDLKKQVTTFAKSQFTKSQFTKSQFTKSQFTKSQSQSISRWIEYYFVPNRTADRLKVDIHDNDAVKQLILGIMDPFRLSL